MTFKTLAILLAAIFAVALSIPTLAQDSQLGRVEFQTSGSPAAQAHFLRGLAALHSFWYEEALEAFREATKADPEFMMGFWGEAMAQNHPLWSEQDTAAARAVVAKIKDTPKLTARERAYLNAVKLLYGKATSVRGMRRIQRRWRRSTQTTHRTWMQQRFTHCRSWAWSDRRRKVFACRRRPERSRLMFTRRIR